MVDSRHPNISVITIKADQLITITTQAGVTIQDKRFRLVITSLQDGPHGSQLGSIDRLVGQKNPGGTFNYNFRMQSIYLIDGEKRQVLTPSKRKCGPDKWLVLPLQTRKSNIHVNPLDWLVSRLKQGEHEEER